MNSSAERSDPSHPTAKKKRARSMRALFPFPWRSRSLSSGLGRAVAARKPGSGPQLGANHLGVGRRSERRSRWRRSARFFGQRSAFDKHAHFVGVEHFAVEKGLRDALEGFLVGVENVACLFVRAADDAFYFLVDVDGGGFAEVAMLGDFAAEEDGLFFLAESERTELAHTPFANHVARDVGGAFDVVAGAGGDVAEEDLFSGAAAHENGQHAFEMVLGVGMLVVGRQLHGEAERHAARDDSDFVHRVSTWSHGGDQSVPGFVIRSVLLFLVGKNHGLALDAHEDFVLGHFEIGHGDELAVLPSGPESGFVGEAFKVGAGEAGSAAGDDGKIHVVSDGFFARVHAEDLFAALDVGASNDHAAVEAAGTEQRGIEHVGTVGGSDEDDALVRLEAVHFDQQRVQSLFAFVVTTAEAGAAMAADRVNFVNEDDAGRVLFALLEQVADAAGANTYKHFDKVGTGDGEERNIRFAGDGAGQQGFAGARGADQQHTFRNAAAKLLELLRVLQELN